ncbi:hypothetical protein OAK91_02825 [Planctomycetaceae bacterium]|nr:hypothetical protein [Planctomycetaceae bacterium]
MRLVHGLAVTICGLIMLSTEIVTAQNLEKKIDIELSETKWTTLLLLKRGPVQPEPIPAKTPLLSMRELEFEGRNIGHAHLLSKCKVDGQFVMQNGFLIPEPEKSAALQLPVCDSFALEGKIGLDGEGGWFILLGWDPETSSGYCLYNTELRTQGSPWRLCQIKGAKLVASSEVELIEEQKVNGIGGIEMQVVEKELTLKILNHSIADHYTLKDYTPGAIVFGTYKPRYGPKKMGIQSLRMKGW